VIRALEVADAPAYLALRLENRAFLDPFEPAREEGFFALDGQRLSLERAVAERDAGVAYGFAIVERPSGDLVGTVSLSMVVRAAWQNANLGYWVAEECGGRGYATQAVAQAIAFAFETLGLHRVQAGVMPRNHRSIRVLERNGLRREGVAERYLRIAGRWEDHLIFAITAEEWLAASRSPRSS
jgi:[ribosomal protein S5]-alanine N-acetyltransferase